MRQRPVPQGEYISWHWAVIAILIVALAATLAYCLFDYFLKGGSVSKRTGKRARR